jgi:hypothetical protein
MTTIEQAEGLVGSTTGLLDRERIIAKAGFNRWLVPPAALCIHLWRSGCQSGAVLGLRRHPAGLGGVEDAGERDQDFLIAAAAFAMSNGAARAAPFAD